MNQGRIKAIRIVRWIRLIGRRKPALAVLAISVGLPLVVGLTPAPAVLAGAPAAGAARSRGGSWAAESADPAPMLPQVERLASGGPGAWLLTTVTPSPPQDVWTYVVQPGDTLYSIAQRFGTTVQALMTLNDLSSPDLIYAGQTLLIPGPRPPVPPITPLPPGHPPQPQFTPDYGQPGGPGQDPLATRYDNRVVPTVEITPITATPEPGLPGAMPAAPAAAEEATPAPTPTSTATATPLEDEADAAADEDAALESAPAAPPAAAQDMAPPAQVLPTTNPTAEVEELDPAADPTAGPTDPPADDPNRGPLLAAIIILSTLAIGGGLLLLFVLQRRG